MSYEAWGEPPDDEHYRTCRTNCDHADVELAEDEECPEGHTDHECTCEAIDEDYADAQAEAQLEQYERRIYG